MYNAHVYLSVYSPVLILGGYGKQRNLNKAVANFNIAAKAGLKNNVYICIIASTCTTCTYMYMTIYIQDMCWPSMNWQKQIQEVIQDTGTVNKQ